MRPEPRGPRGKRGQTHFVPPDGSPDACRQMTTLDIAHEKQTAAPRAAAAHPVRPSLVGLT
ncbi:MAG: hypothetical protein JJ925_16720, partial [Parvibaculum sp.]|nr:hypothetical protein [Parvibaculum sp.]